MEFETYLTEKRINSEAFKTAEPNLWASLGKEFMQLHPKSFTSQKLYLINPIRRKYPLTEGLSSTSDQAEKKKASKPVVKQVKKPGKPIIKRPKIN